MKQALFTIFKLILLVSTCLLGACGGGGDTTPITEPGTPITPKNSSPVVNAGDDISITLNESITLEGSATDSDTADTLTYSWSVEDTTYDIAQPSHTFSNEGEITAILSVSDGTVTVTDTVVITVVISTTLPVCDLASTGMPYCKTTYSDPDGDGWGWENEASCIVVNSAADPEPNSCIYQGESPVTSTNRIRYMNKDLYLSGFNIAWFDFAKDIGNGVDTNQLQQAISDLKQGGGNTLRWWIHTDGSMTPTWENDTTLKHISTTSFIADMTTALNMAQEAGIYIVPSLWSFDMLKNNTYRKPPVDNNYRLLTDDTVLQSYIDQVLKPMVKALNGHPALVAWELFNEPENMTESWLADDETVNAEHANALTLEDLQRVQAKMAAAIHQEAIDNDEIALVTTGSKSMGKYNSDVAGGINLYRDDRLMALANNNPLAVLDFYQAHYYNNEGQNGAWSPFHHSAEYWQVDKPIVIGEYHVSDDLNVLDENIKGADMCQKLAAQGYAGGWPWQWIDEASNMIECNQNVEINLGVGSDIIATVNSGDSILTEISDFGSNPGDLKMHLYVPNNVSINAPLLVANHYCTGTGPVFYTNTQYATLADQYGYIVIYPTANSSDKCFDVATPEALIREGSSDPASILSMIDYVKSHYNIDDSRVFATGVSSGAMMTNVLIGLYPDVFAAGAAFAGVPFTCFATNSSATWSTACATGTVTKTAEEWGNIVRAVYPEYTGTRPRMQLWHGADDDVLHYNNFNEAIKQWTNTHELTQDPIYTDTPKTDYTRTRYGNDGEQALVEAISIAGVGHNVPVDAAQAIRFFGLDED
ncbi:MAG: PHB depolymerase family esterase [Colwellia sp.]